MKIYVDALPKTSNECPFCGKSNKKCSITNDKCCLDKGIECNNLITLVFGEFEAAEDNYGFIDTTI